MGQVSKAVEKQDEQRSQVATLRHAIERNQAEFARALPRHVTPDRFLRCALTALNTVPNLNKCTQHSVMAGLMQAAQLGLEVSDVRGQAYLIPRRNNRQGTYEATFQLGFRGMIDLAARSGITVDVDEIRQNDAYDYERGTNPRLYHKPVLGDRGPVLGYYAVAHFSDGRPPQFVIMSKAEVEEHRDKFASTKRDGAVIGPWADHPDAMSRKTVIRKLLNYLPVSPELREANVIDAEATEPPAPVQATYTPDMAAMLPPEGVDAETGEVLDTSDVIDVDGSDDESDETLPGVS